MKPAPDAATLLSNPPAPRAVLPAALARLLRQPQAFEFHQAVRLATHWLDGQGAAQRPALRFRNGNSMAFPASELQALELELELGPDGADGAPAALRRLSFTPAFMGLLGTAGALPAAYGEQLAAHEAQHRDPAARGFLDVFQHRAVSLFHGSWRKHRLPLQVETPGGGDRTLSLVLGLGGLASARPHPSFHGAVPSTVLAHYAGLLQRPAAGAAQLQRVLADCLGVPVRIRQFAGRWCVLPADSRCRLGSPQAVLAGGAVLGERTWQRELRLRLVLGPLEAAQHGGFLPNGAGATALRELLALSSGTSLEWEVRLRLHPTAVARARLGGAGEDAATRLGFNSFLLSQPSAAQREETVYELHTCAA
ncbi:type VI secretion system baseplate subunit TssG [Azohydromonas lata]|uniref:type VI secretion system baseplate subunit TssG n=1 Tax=Azohydromonas lata TaxID=45677 RepID=UPI0008325707|nr:type VI secretion system baseplate subunit TssG [Azohydromonas lata]